MASIWKIRSELALFLMHSRLVIIFTLVVFTLMELCLVIVLNAMGFRKTFQGSGISVEDIEIERKRLGLDKPFVQRWTLWIVQKCISRRIR